MNNSALVDEVTVMAEFSRTASATVVAAGLSLIGASVKADVLIFNQ